MHKYSLHKKYKNTCTCFVQYTLNRHFGKTWLSDEDAFKRSAEAGSLKLLAPPWTASLQRSYRRETQCIKPVHSEQKKKTSK
uniref:Uncharacterized protein n=1 Tax=Anguilla anguilla TaxID=7936 RepID=A0A0E9WU32_ANGAN